MGLYIAFGTLSLVGLVVAIYWSVRSYRIYQTNLLVSEELDKIIAETLKTIQKNKRGPEASSLGDGVDMNFMEEPGLMSTLITVLINKFGTVRLGMQDFMIADEEYVSVYVDNDTKEIILSLNHTLASDDVYVGFKDPSDNTFY